MSQTTTSAPTTDQRAEASLGADAEAIYRLVARTIRERHLGGASMPNAPSRRWGEDE